MGLSIFKGLYEVEPLKNILVICSTGKKANSFCLSNPRASELVILSATDWFYHKLIKYQVSSHITNDF